MQYNVLGIVAALLSVAGIVFTSSWWCVICFGVAMTLAVVSLFLGKDKLVPILAILFSIAGIYVMLEFAGLVGIIGFKPFWLKNTRLKEPQEVEQVDESEEGDNTDSIEDVNYTNQVEKLEENDLGDNDKSSESSGSDDDNNSSGNSDDSVEIDDSINSAIEQSTGLDIGGEINSDTAQELINQTMNNL